jgi:hypothetical protein
VVIVPRVPFVPRLAIFAEREGSGEGCWMWRVFLRLDLPILWAVCAL